ncbi:hypothetical protein PCANC_14164 [Puccinia coronata f. sp. avenae]|nr:hypothetical protein PCANC_14164 [Puccinia coronata f. sp. avenae]PLW46595.1 hypothetical protein PCASD_07409 [Puccinia coronata f. sp. avenae]
MKLSLPVSIAAGLLLSLAPAFISATCFATRDVGSNIQALKGGALDRRSCFSKKKDDDYEDDEDEGYYRRYARSYNSDGDYGYGKHDGYSKDKYEYDGDDY